MASKQLSCGQNVYIDVNGRESIGIIRSANAAGYYDVAIEGRNVNVKRDEIRLLKNISPKSNVSKTLTTCKFTSCDHIVDSHR